MSEKLEDQILAARKMSADGSLVTYDLTKGVNFEHPRKIAEAFSKVFFENDAVKWFTIADGDVDFKPGYKALILVDEEDNRSVDKAMKDFFKDIEFDEISEKYMKKVDKSGSPHSGLGSVFYPGMLLMKFQEQNINDDDVIIEILYDIKKNTEIRDVARS